MKNILLSLCNLFPHVKSNTSSKTIETMLQVEDNRIRLLSLFAKVVPIRNVGCGMNNIRRQVLMRILWHSGKNVIQCCTESDDEGLLKKRHP